jgi:hypothetical protein
LVRRWQRYEMPSGGPKLANRIRFKIANSLFG